MNANLKLLDDQGEYIDKMINTLSFINDKIVQPDGSVQTDVYPTTYFLKNDKWHISFFTGINQFKDAAQIYQKVRDIHNIPFNLNNPNMNIELKFIVYRKFFGEEWSMRAAYENTSGIIKKYACFINEVHPNLNSLLDLSLDSLHSKWINWLQARSVPVSRVEKSYSTGKQSIALTHAGGFVQSIYRYLAIITDYRDEWEKDTWDPRNLQEYGIRYEPSRSRGYVNFMIIDNPYFRMHYKRFVREKLLAKSNYTCATAVTRMSYISRFLNFVYDQEPSWKDLKALERRHIEKYIEALHVFANMKLHRVNANPPGHVSRSLSGIYSFLEELQIRGYDMAPKKNVASLIFPYDKPTIPKKPYDSIDYIPDYVLQQLIENIERLGKEAFPVVWTMYKTGLRISDVLGLKQSCLLKTNGEFWIESDIKKTYVQGHRVPIDNEPASLLAVLIDESVKNSNDDNNPEKYLFVRYKGQRKGKPYSKNWIRDKMNAFARECNIMDEQGKLYHFKNHSFRHTYAIKMLNSGVDIVTIQELLAHASPEMTLRYAKLLDNTKRKAFDSAVSKGVFRFEEGILLELDSLETQTLDMLWINHKLNAIDTPYGLCLQRVNGGCQYSRQPPCLSCNAGFPCKDLCIGAIDSDIQKYELLMQSTQGLILKARECHRDDIAHNNEELMAIYQDIYSKISQGNIIYSRIDRLLPAIDERKD